jgi:UDP-N-acetyl-D-mannosaminuronate dehydrogenase
LLKESGRFKVYGLDVDEDKMREFKQGNLPKKVNVLHICIGCTNQGRFVDTTVGYIKQFKPHLTIINSTVPPGTTQKINALSEGHLAHSPVRGMHKSRETMKRHLRLLTKYVGAFDVESATLARKHFEDLGLKTKTLKSPVETELAKLFETTYRAWMIACFQEMHRISRYFRVDFDGVVDFLEDTHRVRFDRPIMFPGVIGGHCLIPNAKLLLESYNSEFLRLILESNERRKKETMNGAVMVEVERIKRRVEALEQEPLGKRFKRKQC